MNAATSETGTSEVGNATATAAGIVEPPKLTDQAALLANKPVFNIGAIGKVDNLSDEEYLLLLTHEAIIENEFKGAIDVGLALVEIRDKRLYRGQYGGFPQYYHERWHFGKARVHHLTNTAEAYRFIITAGGLPKPENAFQLRPLFGLDEAKTRAGWAEAARVAGTNKILSRMVKAAVVKLKLRPVVDEKVIEARRGRAERRQQLKQTMTDLLGLIMSHKPYDELIQKAATLDSHVRFFFPTKRVKRRNAEMLKS